MPLMCCLSNTVKTSVSSGVTWNSHSRALGPWGDQAVSSRPLDQRQRTPDGRTCCDCNVERRVDGGWQNGAAGDWQLQMLECSIWLDTVEPMPNLVTFSWDSRPNDHTSGTTKQIWIWIPILQTKFRFWKKNKFNIPSCDHWTHPRNPHPTWFHGHISDCDICRTLELQARMAYV